MAAARSLPANNQFLRLCNALHNRKNWLFSCLVAAVNASAHVYGLIETCKAVGLEPCATLRHLFTEPPKVQTVEGFEALLPHAVAADPTLRRFMPRR